MQRATAAILVLIACGSPQLKEHVADLSTLVPATLEAERPRDGDPRTVKVRVYVDAGVRVNAKWKDEIAEQIDYASQLFTPLLGAQLAIEDTRLRRRLQGIPEVAPNLKGTPRDGNEPGRPD